MFVQIVQFVLKPEASVERFRALSHDMVAWLQAQEGFVGYELYEGRNTWADRLVWRDRECAEQGLKRFLETPLAGNITSQVAEGFTAFMGRAVIVAPDSSTQSVAG